MYRYIVYLFIIIYLLSLSPDDQLYSYISYTCLLGIGFYKIYSSRESLTFFFSPSCFMYLYICLMSLLGSYFIPRGYGLEERYFQIVDYELWQFIDCIIVISLIIILETGLYIHNKNRVGIMTNGVINKIKVNSFNSNLVIIISLLVLVGLSISEINLSLLGGSGNFNYPIMLAITIPLTIYIYINKSKIYINLYSIFVLMIYIINSFSSKREVLFVVILFVFIGYFVRRYIPLGNFSLRKLRFRHVLYALPIIFILLLIIIYSSILRGYGGYQITGFIQAIDYIPVYIKEDFFIDALMANLEILHVYGHLFNSLKYFIEGTYELLLGSTFIKILFIFIPRSIFELKPDSFIHIYTDYYAPLFRSSGGSFPVVIIGEMFWNFSYFAFITLWGFVALISKKYYQMIYNISDYRFTTKTYSYIFLYITFIQVVRGSGVDMWILYYLIGFPFLFLSSKTFNN